MQMRMGKYMRSAQTGKQKNKLLNIQEHKNQIKSSLVMSRGIK